MRLFIAVEVPGEVAAYLQGVQIKLGLKVSSSFHLTLAFLGELDRSAADAIADDLGRITFQSFTLKTSLLGAFPGESSIRVLWVGIKENKHLLSLQSTIVGALNEYGVKNEFSFHPHITLARPNNKMELPRLTLVEKEFKVSSFIFYESILKDDGQQYRKIKEFRSS